MSIVYHIPAAQMPMEITIANISHSQSDSLYTVEGTIRDSTVFGNAVGVNISIAHTKRRTTTDTAGTFKVDGLRLQDVLLFDSNGFRKKNVSIQNVLVKRALKW
jgi:hypothetical protein